jgi:hypothetical protein
VSAKRRIELREKYIRGWYEKDAELLVSVTSADFIFDDPEESTPITRAMMPAYMQRWYQRTEQLGADNRWLLSNQVRQDEDGILTDWEWWQLLGTDLQGAAFVLTTDDGVILERITYFSRNTDNNRNR